MSKPTFERITFRHSEDGGVDVLGWSTYESSSVLAGQPRKVFLDAFSDEAAARKAYPQAQGFSGPWLEPTVSLAHLPDESTPEPGGMYPDDI